MSQLLRAEVVVRGTRPLLMHRFGEDAIPLEKQEQTGRAGNDPEEWRKTVLVDKEGQLYIPDSYLFGCARDGASMAGMKIGRKSASQFIIATLQIEEEEIPLGVYMPGAGKGYDVQTAPAPDQDGHPVFLDVRMVRNPQTKAGNIRYRVGVRPGWELTFHIRWDATVVQRSLMEAAFREGGNLVGIGSGRTFKTLGGIGMGKFQVVRFDVEEVS